MGVFYSDHHTALGFLNRISSNYTKVLHVLSHLIPPNLGSWGFKTLEIESNNFMGPPVWVFFAIFNNFWL